MAVCYTDAAFKADNKKFSPTIKYHMSCPSQIYVISKTCIVYYRVTLHYCHTKDSYLRAIREVAPEMELLLENHGQYMYKNFCDKINRHKKLYISPFHEKMYFEEYVCKYIPPHFFCGKSLPNATLVVQSIKV